MTPRQHDGEQEAGRQKHVGHDPLKELAFAKRLAKRWHKQSPPVSFRVALFEVTLGQVKQESATGYVIYSRRSTSTGWYRAARSAGTPQASAATAASSRMPAA